jgi:flagellar hook-associated protein 2
LATLTAAGVGSGLDINSLVSQLVAAEKSPLENRINAREVRATTQLSALGTLKGGLSGFKTVLETLKSATGFGGHTAKVADDDFYSATLSDKAVTGSYDIEVVALARAHQLASTAYLGGATTVIGTGTLTINSGTAGFTVTLDDTHNTLADIRDAINAAPGNTSVQATIVNEVNGSHLVLTARNTGAANAIRVTTSGGDGGLTQLVYDPLNAVENLDEMREAQDAHIRIADFDRYSATNTIEDAIDGVALDLKKETEVGESILLDIRTDDTKTLELVKKFVSEYNALAGSMVKLRGFKADTATAGPLLGDSMLRGIEEELRRGLSDPVRGLTTQYQSLASLGITKQTDGTLKLDETRFKAALATDRNAVAAVFSSPEGIARRLVTRIDAHLATTGDLTARDKTLQENLATIKKDREALDLRIQTVEARYRKQFTALDSLLARMNSTSSYLASQLANLPKPGG